VQVNAFQSGFGAVFHFGNGVLDAGESCDDGNLTPDDGCTGCRSAECGDGIVAGGVEECDDGNLIDHDTCTECRLPICGDGIVDVGAEDCEDGNDVTGDGCTTCRFEPITCSEQGALATVTFEYDPNTFGDIVGLRLRVEYPPDVLGIPGTLVGPSITERVTNLTGITGSYSVADRDLLPSEQSPDGTDDTIQTLIAVAQGARVPSGPFQSIRFDCTPGTQLGVGQLACVIVEASDPFTNAYTAESIAEGTRCSIRLEAAPVP